MVLLRVILPSRSIIFLLLCILPEFLSGFHASAQQKRGDSLSLALDWLWRSDSLHYLVGEQLRLPSLVVFAPEGKPSDVGVSYASKSLYPRSLSSIPKREESYLLFAQGAKDGRRFALRGVAQFRKKREQDLSHNLSNHSDRFYPFIVADTVRQETKSEIYTLSFDVGYRLNRLFSIGLSAGYEGELRYSRKDPRVQNLSSIVDATSSVSVDLDRFGILTTGAAIQKEIQQLSYSVLVPHSSQLIYIMRPLGEYNFRHSGKNDNGAYRHKYTALSGQGAWVLPARNVLLGLSYLRTTSLLETKDAGVYLSELRGRSISVDLQADVWRWNRSRLSLLGTYTTRTKEGEERIYKRVQIDEHSSLTKPVLVASQQNYTESQYDVTVGGRWLAHFSNSIFSLSLSYEKQYFNARHLSEPLLSSFAKNSISPSLSLRWKNPGKTLYSHTILRSKHLISGHHEQKLNKDQPTYIIEQDRLLLRRGADDTYSLLQEFRLPIGVKKQNAVLLGGSIQMLHWRGVGQTLEGVCHIAYSF